MNEEYVFYMEITNGYVFRQIFEIYDRLIVNVIPIYFKESGVTIRTSAKNNGKKIISDIEIFTDDIINYYLNPDMASYPANENRKACHVEQFNINKLKSIFKSIAKSNSVLIYKTTESDNIYIEIKGITVEKSVLNKISYQLIENDISQLNDEIIPNVKIDINQFCTCMKGMSRGDVDSIIFKVYKDGIEIEGKNTSGQKTKSSKWGELEGDYYKTCVDINVIKALCKISGTTFYSIIKVFCDKTGEVRLLHKVSDFGEHNIYLIDY